MKKKTRIYFVGEFSCDDGKSWGPCCAGDSLKSRFETIDGAKEAIENQKRHLASLSTGKQRVGSVWVSMEPISEKATYRICEIKKTVVLEVK